MYKFNQKVYIAGLIIALILLFGYIIYSEVKSEPERFIKSVIPKSWTFFVEENNIPTMWEGNPECKIIKLENFSEKYVDPNGGFEYNAWHKFWFCPKNWAGKEPTISSETQQYPAKLLCDCDNFKIFHLSLGQNSQDNLPDKVQIKFKTSVFNLELINEDWAINEVQKLPEVIEYVKMLKSYDKKAIFIAQDDVDFWLVQVLEIVNNNGSSHTATFSWYSVNKKTGVIEKKN